MSEKNIQGTAYPNIHIVSIDLSRGASLDKKRNRSAEVSEVSKIRAISSREPVDGTDLTPSRGALNIDLKMHIKVADLNSILNSKFAKHLNLLILQCTSETMHQNLTNNFDSFMASYIDSGITNDYESPSLLIKKASLSNYKTRLSSLTTTSGNNYISLSSIALDQSFSLESFRDTSDISFLSYFAVIYADHNSYIYEYNQVDTTSKNDRKILAVGGYGNVSSEIVISNGTTNKQSFCFKDSKTKEYWLGPKHLMEDGSYMKYAVHLGGNQHNLETINTSNVKIKDHRVFEKILSLNNNILDKKDFITDDSKLIDEARKDRSLSSLQKKRTSFVSDILITRDTSNNARFMFSLDVESMINSFTDYPSILSNLKLYNSQMYSTIVRQAKISEIKVMRKVLKNETRVDEEQNSLTIVRTSDSSIVGNSLNSALYSTTNTDPTGERLEEKPRILGSLEETTVYNLNNSAPIRHFVGTDFDVASKRDGMYQYEIEIDVEDPIKKFLTKQLSELREVIYGKDLTFGIVNYYEDSVRESNYFDQNTGQFKINFMTFYNTKYNTINSRASSYSSSNFIFKAVKKYLDIINIMSSNARNRNLSDIDILTYLLNISSPNCGTPDGIEKFLQLLFKLETALETIINKNSKYKKYRGDVSDSTLARDKSTQTSSQVINYKINHTFKSHYNANTNPSVGFEYLFSGIDQRERNASGLALLTTSDMNSRFDLEVNKYFPSLTSDVSIRDSSGNEYNSGDNIDNSKFAFLSVSNIYFLNEGENTVFSNVNEKVKTYDNKKINDILSQVLVYNQKRKTGASMSKVTSGDTTATNLIDAVSTFDGVFINSAESRSIRRRIERNGKSFSRQPFETNSKKNLVDEGERIFSDEARSKEEQDRLEKSSKKLLSLNNLITNARFLDETNSEKYYFLNDEDGASEIKKMVNSTKNISGLRDAPNQIKALFLSLLNSENVNQPKVFKDIGSEYNRNKDTFRNPEYSGFIFFNYKNLRKIEVFQGYETNGESVNLDKPLFRTLTKQDLNRSSNTPLLCRHTQYTDNMYGINPTPDSSLPTYNEFFLVSSVSGDFLKPEASNSFVLNTFYKTYYTNSVNQRNEKAYKQFFKQRAATVEKPPGQESDIVRQEYLNSNIILRDNNAFSMNFLSLQELNNIKVMFSDIEKESPSDLYKQISNSIFSDIVPLPIKSQSSNLFSTAKPLAGNGQAPTGGTSTAGSMGGNSGAGSGGGSTY